MAFDKEAYDDRLRQNRIANKYKKDNGNRLVGTYADLTDEFNRGFAQNIEGTVDFVAGIIGKFGTKDFKDNVQKFIEHDYSNDAIDIIQKYNPYRELLNKVNYGNDYTMFSGNNENDLAQASYLHDMNSTTNNIVRGVAQAGGQLLATIGTSYIGGAIASNLGASTKVASKVGKVTSMAQTGLSAGGRGIAEALNEGANYDEALGYGALSGAGEMAIEGLSGGIGKVLGKPINAIPGVGKAITKGSSTILGKIGNLGLQSISEGLEEVASDYVNPLFKTIYKNNYEKPEFKDVAVDFAVGALSSALVSGAVSITQQGKVETTIEENKPIVSDINFTLGEIEQLNTKIQGIDFSNPTYQETKKLIIEKQNSLNKQLETLKSPNSSVQASTSPLNTETDKVIGQTQKPLKTALQQKYENVTPTKDNVLTNKKVQVKQSKNIKEFTKRTDLNEEFKKSVENKQLNTVAFSDKEAISGIKKVVNDNSGYEDLDTQYNSFMDKYQSGKRIDKVDIGIAYKTADVLANKYQDYDKSASLLQAVSIYLTESGRVVQGAKLMNYIYSPSERIKLYDKMVERAVKRQSGRKLNKTIVNKRKAKYFESDKQVLSKRYLDSELKRKDVNLETKIKEQIANVMLKTDIYSQENILDAKKEIKKIIFENGLQNNKVSTQITKDYVNSYVEKVKRLSEQYDTLQIVIPESVIEQTMVARNKQEIDEAYKLVASVINEQYNASIWEKIEAYRTFSMLGNAKTHIRNFTGNLVMNQVRKFKNGIATAIEKVAIKDKNSRTKTSIRPSKEIKAYATELFDVELFNKNKYDQETKPMYQSKAFSLLEKARKWNMTMLEKEDIFFMRKIFIDTFSKWATAKGYTAEQLSNNQAYLDSGLEYAVKEANIYTFKEYSKLANTLNDLQAKNGATRLIVGGIIPFKTTPINIVKIGVRYSPLGLINSLTKNTYLLKKGNMDINTYIDNISQGLTGSSILALGLLLARLGFLAINDDDEYEYNKTKGVQTYSLNIGGKSFSMDWLSPSAIPLYMGVAIYNNINNDNDNVYEALMQSFTHMADPITEMSMLQSINNTLQSFKQDNTGGALGNIIGNSIKSYGTSFIPTLSGQLARTLDSYSRTTTATKNNQFNSKTVQKYWNTIIAKVPGLSMTLEPYVDCWGEKSTNYNGFATGITNALQQTASPTWWSNSKADKVDNEISRLIQVTGDKTIIPNIPNSYYTKNGERYDMTAKEYTQYKINIGKNSKSTLNKIMSTSWYNNLGAELQCKFINKTYEYARDYEKKTGLFTDFNSNIISFQSFTTNLLYCKYYLKTKEERLRYINSLPLSLSAKNYLIKKI